MEPLILPPNQPPTFYRGSGAIPRFRNTPPAGDGARPEDWLASTTARFGHSPDGLSHLPDGTLLTDAVHADPEAWLGPAHLAAHGADTALLVKLLDAGERLPLHAHPGRDFARAHLGSVHGKTEAWYVVAAEPDAEVRMGFRRAISERELAGWMAERNLDALLDAVHRVPVSAGDAVLCPAGLPHTIGSGVLVVEIQEPTDYSVLLEWEGFDVDGPADGHLGLGYERALSTVDRRHWNEEALSRLRGPTVRSGEPHFRSVLPAAADPFFRAELLEGDVGMPVGPGFSVLVVLDGSGTLSTASGTGREQSTPLTAGQTVLLPYAAGPTTLSGSVTALRCRPPAPDTA